MAISVFLYNSLVAYAFPKRLLDGTWIDVPLSEYGEEISYFIQYAVNQIGAIYNKDFETWLKNNETYQDLYDDNGRLAKNISIDTETGEVTYTKEIMIVLKTALDEYAKTEQSKEENGGFILLPTTDFSTVPVDYFINAKQFRTFRNIVLEKGCLAVMTRYRSLPMRFVDPFSDPDHPILPVGTLSDLNRLENYPYMPVGSYYFCADEWQYHKYRVQAFPDEGTIYTSCSDAIDHETASNSDLYNNSAFINWDVENHGAYNSDAWILYSTTGERIRVFVSQNAAKNYSVGNRKVYFTENYYNYVPEDLSVSIDDLQKTVDDLQKVIDQLLGQIGDNTSEKEIEELLKKILEAIQNQPGGGDGPGDGDVNVDIDLSSTNTLLSKILAKITQISDKISSSAGQTMTDVVESINNLGDMLKKYLIAITGDLDDIKGKLDQMTEEEFSEKTDSFLKETTDSFSEIAEVAKGKFPFSIPNDMRTLLEKLSIPPPSPETAALYSTDTAGTVPYSGDHGGGGASRPPGGISSIEQGNGGGSFGISESGAPVIRCPIVLKRLGIDYAIKIDLSEFDKVAALSRALLTFIYIYGLYNLTFKVMGLWGDLTE